ncbi:hypothetical protein NC651_036513 [Populus alba x Populus x berolinensis]|nr:hypothetical protein NC651_036513 [Populus alba x Populus x berolinensis]
MMEMKVAVDSFGLSRYHLLLSLPDMRAVTMAPPIPLTSRVQGTVRPVTDLVCFKAFYYLSVRKHTLTITVSCMFWHPSMVIIVFFLRY